jgi:hypothetical protein
VLLGKNEITVGGSVRLVPKLKLTDVYKLLWYAKLLNCSLGWATAEYLIH